jgi:hypothetical protein
VSLRQVRVMSGSLGITSLVKPGGFAMVFRRLLVVLRGFDVMFRCLFWHFILRAILDSIHFLDLLRLPDLTIRGVGAKNPVLATLGLAPTSH